MACGIDAIASLVAAGSYRQSYDCKKSEMNFS
jgi:hypothetical protein